MFGLPLKLLSTTSPRFVSFKSRMNLISWNVALAVFQILSGIQISLWSTISNGTTNWRYWQSLLVFTWSRPWILNLFYYSTLLNSNSEFQRCCLGLKALIFSSSPLIIMQMPLLILLMPPLSTEMQSLIIINRNIREANSKEEIMANNSINVLLDVKYAMKKGIMPWTIKINTQNMMHILLKHLQIAQLAMTLLTGILI